MTYEEEKKLAARVRAKAWREANPERSKAAIEKCKAAKPEKYRALGDKWKAAHKDRVKQYREKRDKKETAEYMREWVKNNIERRREIARTWNKNNREKVNAVLARRRAAKLSASPKWANKFFIAEAYHLARLRTKVMGFQWHVDHIVPLKSPLVCGLHVEHNLQVIPGRENQRKNNRVWPDMP